MLEPFRARWPLLMWWSRRSSPPVPTVWVILTGLMPEHASPVDVEVAMVTGSEGEGNRYLRELAHHAPRRCSRLEDDFLEGARGAIARPVAVGEVRQVFVLIDGDESVGIFESREDAESVLADWVRHGFEEGKVIGAVTNTWLIDLPAEGDGSAS